MREGEYMGIKWMIDDYYIAYILLSDLDITLCERLKIKETSFGVYFIDDHLYDYEEVY